MSSSLGMLPTVAGLHTMVSIVLTIKRWLNTHSTLLLRKHSIALKRSTISMP